MVFGCIFGRVDTSRYLPMLSCAIMDLCYNSLSLAMSCMMFQDVNGKAGTILLHYLSVCIQTAHPVYFF